MHGLCVRRIPSGSAVMLDNRSTHRDPDIWPRAADYLPERWLPGHEDLAPKQPHAYNIFGFGSRLCIGCAPAGTPHKDSVG